MDSVKEEVLRIVQEFAGGVPMSDYKREKAGEATDAIMSAFKRASGVVVKELEWRTGTGTFEATVAGVGEYLVCLYEDGLFDATFYKGSKVVKLGDEFPSPEAAKDACENHAKRITSAVEPKNSADNLDSARSIQNGLGSAVEPSCVVTDAELEELEALLADCKCTGGTLDEAIHRKAQLAHWNASKGVRGHVITKWCSVEAHTVLATIEAFKVLSLISTIRELRAKEAARDRFVEAARVWAKLSPTNDQLQRREDALKAAIKALAALEEQS